MRKKPTTMPEEPLKESFHPWFIHKISTDKVFAGYQWERRMDASGRTKRVLVYHGDYYRFNYQGEALSAVKRRSAALTLAALALQLVAATAITTSTVANPVVSGGLLFALIPAIYQVMGLWTLCRAKEPFEMQVPLLSVRRIKASGLGILCLLVCALAAHVICMVIAPDEVRFTADLLFIGLLALSLALQLLLRKLQLSFGLEKVPANNKEDSP